MIDIKSTTELDLNAGAELIKRCDKMSFGVFSKSNEGEHAALNNAEGIDTTFVSDLTLDVMSVIAKYEGRIKIDSDADSIGIISALVMSLVVGTMHASTVNVLMDRAINSGDPMLRLVAKGARPESVALAVMAMSVDHVHDLYHTTGANTTKKLLGMYVQTAQAVRDAHKRDR